VKSSTIGYSLVMGWWLIEVVPDQIKHLNAILRN